MIAERGEEKEEGRANAGSSREEDAAHVSRQRETKGYRAVQKSHYC